MAEESRVEVGWREWVALPDLELPAIKAKMDTGARTSALHAWRVDPYRHGGAPWIAFQMHPLQRDTRVSRECHAPVLDRRQVTDSGGHRELRYVIETTVVMDELRRRIEVTLTDRDTMRFRMLLGRQAMRGLRVVPDRSYLASTALTRRKAARLYR